MPIDINELRRKVNSTDVVDHIDLHANINPFLSELLDRLEAAEKELAELRSSMKFRTSLIGRTEAERDALRAKIAEMGKQEPAAEWFDWLPQGTTHISSIRTVTIPCFGLEARFNAFKYIDGVLYTYRTDSDNEYGEWVKAASRYRNGVLPTVYPLSGAQPAPSVPDATVLLRRAAMAMEVVGTEWRESDPTLRLDLASALAAAAQETKP